MINFMTFFNTFLIIYLVKIFNYNFYNFCIDLLLSTLYTLIALSKAMLTSRHG
jgi:hypothetical protein